MRKTIAKSIGIGVMLILSIAIVILGSYATIVPDDCNIDEPHYHDEDLYYIDTTYSVPCTPLDQPEFDWTKVNIDTIK